MDEHTLRVLLNTLNRITVSGEENMGYVLGCIKLVKDALAQKAQERSGEQK